MTKVKPEEMIRVNRVRLFVCFTLDLFSFSSQKYYIVCGTPSTSLTYMF